MFRGTIVAVRHRWHWLWWEWQYLVQLNDGREIWSWERDLDYDPWEKKEAS